MEQLPYEKKDIEAYIALMRKLPTVSEEISLEDEQTFEDAAYLQELLNN